MFYGKIRIKQGPSYISVCPLRILYNSKFILMATSLGTNAVVVTRVHYITIKGTENPLKGLNPKKASGPDEISPGLLKELHHEIAPILTKTFQSSLQTGIVPDDWKSALFTKRAQNPNRLITDLLH